MTDKITITGKPTFSEIENRNFLSALGFHFSVVRAPLIAFYGTQVNIPSMDLDVETQPNYLNDIPRAGDKIQFGDLTFEFLVDEDLKNYMEIQNWMRGLGFPESLDQIYKWQEKTEEYDYPNNYIDENILNLYSDGTLTIYNSANVPHFKVVFQNMFPYSLSTLQFDSQLTEEVYLKAQVSFKYTIYNIRDIKCC